MLGAWRDTHVQRGSGPVQFFIMMDAIRFSQSIRQNGAAMDQNAGEVSD